MFYIFNLLALYLYIRSDTLKVPSVVDFYSALYIYIHCGIFFIGGGQFSFFGGSLGCNFVTSNFGIIEIII